LLKIRAKIGFSALIAKVPVTQLFLNEILWAYDFRLKNGLLIDNRLKSEIKDEEYK